MEQIKEILNNTDGTAFDNFMNRYLDYVILFGFIAFTLLLLFICYIILDIESIIPLIMAFFILLQGMGLSKWYFQEVKNERITKVVEIVNNLNDATITQNNNDIYIKDNLTNEYIVFETDKYVVIEGKIIKKISVRR